ncbi:S9 family peptidase [Corynebacterium sp.]|uniref:S9 family peptidase n=1 Tax=Corynebacterium sp. TaxID=1720 RepID=UPI0026DAF805|nr:S9 family peptidase [Corynebacterium sp.]MDO5076937.1 S9 family peptidase [Corynebacterium sp.]
MTERVTPPTANKVPLTRSHHGREFIDNYEWLRDKTSPETIAYLEAENEYTASHTANLAALRERIFQEIKGRVKETDMTVPTRSGDWWYFVRTEEGKSYSVSCRVPAHDWNPPEITQDALPGEQVILDSNELAEGHEFFALGAGSVTLSGRYLAYSTDVAGDERYTLRIKDLATGELLSDEIPGIAAGAVWAGEDYVFYQRVDAAWRPDSVWRHRVGTPASEDVQVFHEADERFWVGVDATRSEKYLLIELGSKTSSEVWVLEMDNPTGEFRCLVPREERVEYGVDHAVVAGEDRWLVVHNATGPNFELGECAVGELHSLADLNVLVPHNDDVRIEGVDPFATHIAFGYRAGGIGRLALMKLDPGYTTFTELEFAEDLYSVGTGNNPEWETPRLRYTYTSFISPSSIYELDVQTDERTLLKQQEVLGGYDPTDYTATRLWVTARDGVQVPVSLVHRADLDLSQPNPTLLYGYGSYETPIDPGFSVARLSMLDRGMIFAVAHVRGGGEMGRKWYDTGKLLAKKNTFTDFIDVADYLIEQKVTAPEMLAANGGSAGGLLMGAVANMASDRFRAIAAIVPFVDPLTSILMPELPLTVVEWEEWGNPLADPEVYDYMASYAPYENIEAKAYPNILAVTSINDTRVLYVEPAKWIAALRATATGGEFLLKTEMAAGHGGVSGRYDSWRQTAFEFAWIINQVTGKLD